jgi:hypothetical protein
MNEKKTGPVAAEVSLFSIDEERGADSFQSGVQFTRREVLAATGAVTALWSV